MTLLKTIWQRDGELVVAFGPDGEVTLAELRRGSLQLARAMARLAGPDRPGMGSGTGHHSSQIYYRRHRPRSGGRAETVDAGAWRQA